MAVHCPICKGTRLELMTPDYGYGYGTEFQCLNSGCMGRNGYFRFSDKSDEARAVSDAARGVSASNARRYRDG